MNIENVTNVDGTVVGLEGFSIQLRKSPLVLQYPIYYYFDFPSEMTEDIIYQSDPFVSGCVAGALATDPTCGFAYGPNGKPIADSEGFCCTCSLSQLLGLSTQGTRGTLNCQLFGLVSSSAHCLRESDLIYQAFTIGPAIKSYEIVATVISNGKTVETLTVSPEVLNAYSTNCMVSLQGDFSSFTSPPDYQDQFLFVPYLPADNAIVQGGMANWMLINQDNVDKSGLSCNKIGVSYSAFNNQPNACENPPGTCLQNQLVDFYNAGQNFLGTFGNFMLNQSSGNNNNQQLVLSYYVQQFQPSVIVLTLNADQLQYVVNVSPGILVRGYVDPFEAMSMNGLMIVEAQNTGNVIAQYTVSVVSCSANINPVPSQAFSINYGANVNLSFVITTNSELQTSDSCLAQLFNSNGQLLDQMQIQFDTTQTIHENLPEPINANGTTISNPSSSTSSSSNGGSLTSNLGSLLGSLLSSIFGGSCSCSLGDISCDVLNTSCWGPVVIVVIVLVILVVVVIGGLVVFTASGGWSLICKILICCCKLNKKIFKETSKMIDSVQSSKV